MKIYESMITVWTWGKKKKLRPLTPGSQFLLSFTSYVFFSWTCPLLTDWTKNLKENSPVSLSWVSLHCSSQLWGSLVLVHRLSGNLIFLLLKTCCTFAVLSKHNAAFVSCLSCMSHMWPLRLVQYIVQHANKLQFRKKQSQYEMEVLFYVLK